MFLIVLKIVWTENRQEDARILDMSLSSTSIPDEDVGQVSRLEVSQEDFDVMNLEGHGNRVDLVGQQIVPNAAYLEDEYRDGLRSEIPKAGKVNIIEYMGEPHRVREVSEVIHSLLSSEE
ncbi:hypothetical protein V6N13_013172 [Hibiscus sabdariffa]